jgi:hypothetical protein
MERRQIKEMILSHKTRYLHKYNNVILFFIVFSIVLTTILIMIIMDGQKVGQEGQKHHRRPKLPYE